MKAERVVSFVEPELTTYSLETNLESERVVSSAKPGLTTYRLKANFVCQRELFRS